MLCQYIVTIVMPVKHILNRIERYISRFIAFVFTLEFKLYS